MADIRIVADYSDEIIREIDRRVKAGLNACGIQAEGYAKDNVTAAGRVGTTGALRNGINYRVKEDTCYVGTAVDYAIYNEYGTGIYAADGRGRKSPWAYKDARGQWHRTRGMKPIHFLKKALQDHKDQYREILIHYIKG